MVGFTQYFGIVLIMFSSLTNVNEKADLVNAQIP